jgi:hypothetical protein
MPATVCRPDGFAVSARLPVVGNGGVGLHITALLPPLPVGDGTRVGRAHKIFRKSEQKDVDPTGKDLHETHRSNKI